VTQALFNDLQNRPPEARAQAEFVVPSQPRATTTLRPQYDRNNSPDPTVATRIPLYGRVFVLGQQCSTALRQISGLGFDSLAAHKPLPSQGILRSDHRVARSAPPSTALIHPSKRRRASAARVDPHAVRAEHRTDATVRSPTRSAQEAGRHPRRRVTARRVHRRFAPVPDDRGQASAPVSGSQFSTALIISGLNGRADGLAADGAAPHTDRRAAARARHGWQPTIPAMPG
jgi:hypothetical protein